MDRFTHVVSDGNGATATTTVAVEVMVVPVNDAPVAIRVIPDQALAGGGGETTVELEQFFEDIARDALEYRASSSDPWVAAAMVSGAVLTVTPYRVRVGGRNGDGEGCGRPRGDADVRGGSERPAGARCGFGRAGRDGAVASGQRADDAEPATRSGLLTRR